jgi:hypothetical protein
VGALAAVATVSAVVGATSEHGPQTHLDLVSPFYTPIGTLGTLPPVSVPPAIATCQIPVTHEADGNVSPLLCPDGGVNVIAWAYYAKSADPILNLGSNSSATSVERALCEVQGATLQTRLDEYRLASAYYGWRFSTSPTNVLTTSTGCSRFTK